MTAKVLALFVITVITSIFYGHNYFINILACFRKIGNSLIIEPILFATRSVRVTSISLFFYFFLLKSQVLEDVCFFWLSNKEACAITVSGSTDRNKFLDGPQGCSIYYYFA